MKKIILLGMLVLTVGGVVANAATSETLYFKQKKVVGTISRTALSGTSETNWSGISGFSATTCIEAVNTSGEVIGGRLFDSDLRRARAKKDTKQRAYAYNASHTIAKNSNVYVSEVATYTQVR